MRDPRHVRALSVLSLFEQQQERLPPVLVDDTVLSYDDLPWAATFSVQVQLKRLADLMVSALLLLLCLCTSYAPALSVPLCSTELLKVFLLEPASITAVTS